jgi:selenocysteine lyase/cysteine desulfurase
VTEFHSFRALFPALERVTYLNTATAAPGAIPILDALRRVHGQWESGEFSWQAWEADGEATRRLFAEMIGGQPEDVALASSLSEAAATVAASLEPGRVVVGEREFQSNLFPWLALRDRGFEVVEVPSVQGVVPTEALVEAIDERTVLAALSEVQSSNGFRVDVAAVGERCRRVGARFFVNLPQTLGALRFDVDRAAADYVAAHGYKWLLGPRAAAWLWVRPQRLNELRPLAPNWKSVAEPYADYYGGPMELSPGTRRLDASLAWFSWPGARAALELLASLDAAAVEARCLELAAAFRAEAANRGFTLSPQEVPSQVLSVQVSDPLAVKERLSAQRVIAAVRADSVRFGFHAYNDRSDVQAALDALGTK